MHRDVPTFIIDPVMLFREGLRRILLDAGFQPVWCSDRPPVGSIPALSEKTSPLLIVGSEVEEAIVQISEMKRHYASVRPVLLLDSMIHKLHAEALICFADTIILRSSSCDMLINTLKLVLHGSIVRPSEMLDGSSLARNLEACTSFPALIARSAGMEIKVPRAPSADAAAQMNLSARELSVVNQLRDGLSNKEIARKLGITEATVKVHVRSILRKACLKNRTQVAMWASSVERSSPGLFPAKENKPALPTLG